MVELGGHNVEIIDYNAERFDQSSLQHAVQSADAVGMTIVSQPTDLEASMMIAQKIKQFAPDIPLILGGPHCNFFPEQSLRSHQADICVRGEGEYIIGPLLDALEGKHSLSAIPGLVYQQNGQMLTTKPNQQIMDLDKLPFPARHLVAKYDYGNIFGTKIMRGKATSLITSRGCPCRCSFCQLSSSLALYRARSVANTIKEIDALVSQGYQSLAFADDNFLANKKHVEQIMDHIIQQRYDLLMWILDTRVDTAERRIYEKMRDAGVRVISFGIESGNQEILDFYNKKITTEQARKAITLSNEMGFIIDANFILGAPMETKKQFDNTLRFAKSLPINHATFNHLEYLAGTPLWNKAVEEGKIDPEESLVMSDRRRGLALYDAGEIDAYIKKANNAFYFNPRYWIRQLIFALRHHNPLMLQLGVRRVLGRL
jgi:radical SAM superfamily enzyme YgiQ (UPF0313 family)